MKKRTITYLSLLGILALVTSCHSSLKMSPKSIQAGSSHAKAGSAYSDSYKAALSCRDLTDEEMDEADNIPGGGYSDGKWTGENSDECKIGAQRVFQDEDGTLIILEDDGEVTEVACIECSGYENVHFIEIDGDKTIVEINGRVHTVETKPGFWTNIDPETGEIRQVPINDVLGSTHQFDTNTPLIACQWPDTYPGSEDDGVAYREGQAAAEDADCHSDE